MSPGAQSMSVTSTVSEVSPGRPMITGRLPLISQVSFLRKNGKRETGISVRVAENPLDCVALGTGMVLENLDELREVLDNDDSSL